MKPNEEIQYVEIESQWDIGKIKKGQDYSWSALIDLYSDLVDEYKALQEELKNMKRDLEDNYRPIPFAEQVGINDKDFI